MPVTQLVVDDGPHSMDGLLLHGWDGPAKVEAFIGRRVMDIWVVDVLYSDITESGEVLDLGKTASQLQGQGQSQSAP